MKKEYEVGYGRPPKEHQFRKGQSGNPRGRPKAKMPDPQENSMASILKRVGEQVVRINGVDRTLMEIELLALQSRAAKGEVAASRHLARLRKDAGLLAPELPKHAGGVLVVPGVRGLEEWSAAAALQQAKFRGEDPEGMAELERDM